MSSLDASLRHVVVCATTVLLAAMASTLPAQTTVPAELREFTERRLVRGLEFSGSQARLVVGDKFRTASPALQVRAKAVARTLVRKSHPQVTQLVIVDSKNEVIEAVPIKP